MKEEFKGKDYSDPEVICVIIEQVVQEALDKAREGRTCIVIAHDCHHPERRLDSGVSEWQNQGARHTPAAAGTERHLFHHGPVSRLGQR